jgi:hypothetical protein
MPLRLRSITILLIVGLLLPAVTPANAQKADSLYFPETGHWVSGDFLTFYQAGSDPQLLFGYPITDSFADPLSGESVQYFQKSRFELHPEADKPNRVQLSPLGSLLYQAGNPVDMPIEKSACRYYAEQKHYVCYAFLGFFDNHGGVGQFGYPISEIEQHENLYVQYFERARLEWHPELPAGQRVTISELGRVYFDQSVGDLSLLQPNPGNATLKAMMQLQARAFVSRAIISPGAKQTLYVMAQDQYLRPVSRANVAVTVRFPKGGEERYRLPLTNNDGLSSMEINLGEQPSNQIVILDVEVTQGGLQAWAGTWFRIWW